MSSSGLVPLPSSNREANEYAPSYAPEPSAMVPAPSLRLPCQRADEERVGMVPTLADPGGGMGRCCPMRRWINGRWVYLAPGVPLAAAGLGCAVVSLAVPWARYHVTGTAVGDRPIADDAPVAVFQVSGGTWYVLAVFALGGVVARGALGGAPGRPGAAGAAPVGGAGP